MLLCPRKDATSDTVAVVRAVFLVDLSVVHSLPPGSIWFLQESGWWIKPARVGRESLPLHPVSAIALGCSIIFDFLSWLGDRGGAGQCGINLVLGLLHSDRSCLQTKELMLWLCQLPSIFISAVSSQLVCRSRGQTHYKWGLGSGPHEPPFLTGRERWSCKSLGTGVNAEQWLSVADADPEWVDCWRLTALPTARQPGPKGSWEVWPLSAVIFLSHGTVAVWPGPRIFFARAYLGESEVWFQTTPIKWVSQ